MKACSSREAAQSIGISLMTLQRYIAARNWIKAPNLQNVGGVTVRLWSAADIERARKLIEKKKSK